MWCRAGCRGWASATAPATPPDSWVLPAGGQLGLAGWVQNEDDGTVTLEVQGDPALFARMFDMIAAGGYIQITGIRSQEIEPDPWARGFSVRGY